MKHLIAASVALAAVMGAANAQETIKIGALYNVTGGMSSLDGPSLKGAQLAVKQINADGGLLGKQIELIAPDGKTDQQETAKAAQRLISEGVVAGIGESDTTFVMAGAPLFQEAGIPFVTSGATHPELPQWVGDYMFMAPFGDDDQSYAIADYAYDELGTRKVAVWTDNSMDFTKALSKFFVERFEERGGEIVGTDSFMMGDTDFSAQIARLASIDPAPDAVFVSAIPSEAGLSVKQIREQGITMPIVSGDGFDTELVSTVPGPELANDVYFSTHTYRADDRDEVKAFIADYKAEYGIDPENAFAPLGYDALMLVADAIRRADSAEPAKIRDALAETRGFKGVTGEISYTRETMVPPKPVSLISVHNGKYTVEEIWKPETE
ncbi:ABC transporter substrate-binding protein [Nitratireductor aquimarinus]|uniref:ABC transporter substrate-binding protein n=1 Tax=Nitratireductor aquimarinus TaxID=889300 RepID=A0ABU4AM59_9HYPH|nr:MULTISPECIES: ABC transporter substrate-binding protein [Alphaproteobacteria]MBY6024709.1 ABC transporter substrate-binding protein [Nitratireductor sp. DP7N14-4]MBN7759458.1 ABC transporter substrate-binding protein [Nitratireductor aquimarinus]MBN7760514.1 ABC transporter substrate-binding protein [Nitratireductor aquibiodomus]MBN7776391.1 ABC transporter substrate-binding protein [Nitratireductor pacificus]MBN7779258.1 ABC transporter substrate-binding protein [Nitratireductor pacificus]